MRSNFFNQDNLYRWFLIILMLPCIVLSFTEPYSLWVSVSSVMLPLAFYMVFLCMFRKPGYFLLALTPLLLTNGYQLVLLYLFNEAVISPDMFLTIVTTDSGESGELMRTIWPAVLIACLVYFSAIGLGVYSVRSKNVLDAKFIRRHCWLALVFASMGLGCLLINSQRGFSFSAKTDIYPVNVGYNLYFSVNKYIKTQNHLKTSSEFTYDSYKPSYSAKREVYLMMIGETSRALNWQLYGYPRHTNPNLSRRDDIIIYKDVLTQGNTTHKIVPLLLSPASAEDFECIYSSKGIMTAFKEAGFTTAFISNQISDRAFIDDFAAEADTMIRVKDYLHTTEHPVDNEGVTVIKDVIDATSGPLFIVYHTYGSHFEYSKRYKSENAAFIPHIAGALRYKERPTFVNAYDNSICNTDRVINDIIELLSDSAYCSSMIYTSDHGEDLMDDSRKLFLHSSPVPSYYQLHVPLILWMSPGYIKDNPLAFDNALMHTSLPISSNAVFHTMIDIAGIQTPYCQDTLSLIDSAFSQGVRHYLDQHDRPAEYINIRLKLQDLNMMKSMGVEY